MSQVASTDWLRLRFRAIPEEIGRAWYFKQWDIVYVYAVEHDKEIARLCRLRGADDQRIIEQVAKDEAIAISEVYAEAASWGNTGLLTICKDLGLVDVNRAMIIGAENGCQGIMRLCKLWGATNINDAMLAAQKVMDIVLCKELGADAFEELAVRAVHLNKESVLRLREKKWGVEDFGHAMAAAQRYKRDLLVLKCELYGARL